MMQWIKTTSLFFIITTTVYAQEQLQYPQRIAIAAPHYLATQTALVSFMVVKLAAKWWPKSKKKMACGL